MAIKWEKVARIVNADGTTIIYEGAGTDLTIESRKRHIPHAGGRPGTWDHTSYFVLKRKIDMAEKFSLKDAKEYAEELFKEGK